HQLHQPFVQLAVARAQGFELVSRKRRGGSVFARHHQLGGDVRKMLQEARVLAQIFGDVHRFEALLKGQVGHAGLRWHAGSLVSCARSCNATHTPSHSPSNTKVAGPVIHSVWPGPFHAIRRLPPGSSTHTSSPTRSRLRNAATAAQAPLPQASVQPAPRSCTRNLTWCASTTCTKPE